MQEHIRKAYSEVKVLLKKEQNEKKLKQRKSYSEYRDMTQRHVRTDKGPNEIFSKPLTVGQEFGWNKSIGLQSVIKGRKSCPETVYADELTRSGIIF